MPGGPGVAGLRGQGTPTATPLNGAGPSTAAGESVLERRYPGVVRALVLMWGHPELTEFLDRVAAGLDERLRDIDPAAMAELMLIGQVHRSFCVGRPLRTDHGHPALRNGGAWRPAFQRG